MIQIVSGAAVDTSDPDLCPSCITHQGLCRKHERGVLPLLKEPHWYRLVHSGMYRELKDEKDHSPEGLAIRRRKERRRAKRYEQLKHVLNTTARPTAGLSFTGDAREMHEHTHSSATAILGSQRGSLSPA